LRLPRIRVGKLRKGEIGLHSLALTPRRHGWNDWNASLLAPSMALTIPHHIRPGLRMPAGSQLALRRVDSSASGGLSGCKTGTAWRMAAGARIRVAWPPSDATALRITAAPASGPSP